MRKDGNRVRVNVQLINAVNDEHIWSEVYDRDLTDVFAIQTDLAQKIAKELQAKLSPSEKAQMTRKPTENGEAYLAFVQAHTLHRHLDDQREAAARPSNSTSARCSSTPTSPWRAAHLSRLEGWIYRSMDPTPARREKARSLAERALTLQPDSPEGSSRSGILLLLWRPRLRKRTEGISPSRSAGCRTTPTSIWPSARSSAGRGNGRSRTPTSKKRSA